MGLGFRAGSLGFRWFRPAQKEGFFRVLKGSCSFVQDVIGVLNFFVLGFCIYVAACRVGF